MATARLYVAMRASAPDPTQPQTHGVLFRSADKPTEASQLPADTIYAIGPFRTRSAAEICAQGRHTYAVQCVAQLERLAKLRRTTLETCPTCGESMRPSNLPRYRHVIGATADQCTIRRLPTATCNRRKPIGLTHMVDGYLECALWASTTLDGSDKPLDSIDRLRWTKEATAIAKAQCKDFLLANAADCDAFLASYPHKYFGDIMSQLGHDFFLTRNHHGTGFWDRGLGELGERLSKASHAYGSATPDITARGYTYWAEY